MKNDQNIIRSDAQIEKIIVEALAQNRRIDASRIGVKVKNGKVTLTGEVPDAAAQSSANWITTAIAGVTDVINHLTVRRPATLTMTDIEKKDD